MIGKSPCRDGVLDDMTDAQLWPLFGLEVSTPNLALRYVTDELAFELAALAAQGIHDPQTMPFASAWTDVASPELERNALRYYWLRRSETSVQRWSLNFAVCVDEAVVGTCLVDAADFTSTRTAETGSWLGRRYQGVGIGTEMRTAALGLIFDGLGAETATTSAWHDNGASLGVTRSLGYTQTGKHRQPRRGRDDEMIDFAISRARWRARPRPPLSFKGIEATREFLGLQGA